jgi:hypothetical protein
MRPKLEGLVQYFALALAPNKHLGGFCSVGSDMDALPPGPCAIKHWLYSNTNRNKKATRISQVALPNCDIPRGSSLPPRGIVQY